MTKKRYIAAILGMVLTMGLFFAGCDDGSLDTSSGGNSGELNGTWKKDIYEIIISGNSYVMRENGANYGRGTISYSLDNSTFTFQSTHAWQNTWVPYKEITNGTLNYGGNTLTIFNLDNYTFLAGSWKRESSNTAAKTIVITGFSGNTAYNGKAAVIMLFPSVLSIENEEEPAAIGGIKITGGSTLTIPLKTDKNLTTNWSGTGDFVIILTITDGTYIEKWFIYSDVMPDALWTNVLKYGVTETTSSIPFSKFKDITSMME
jgi:hypothetical protein